MSQIQDKHAQLKSKLEQLSGLRNRSQRGIYFEGFLGDIFRDACMEYEGPQQPQVDQIDGKARFAGRQFIIEAKWTDTKTTKREIDEFLRKMKRLDADGLFISWSGFKVDPSLHHSEKSRLLLIEGREIREFILNKKISMWELIDYKSMRSPMGGFLPKRLAVKHTQRWTSLLAHLKNGTEREIRPLRSKYTPSVYVERALETELYKFLEARSLKNVFMLIEKAGSGKTNLVCHFAQRVSHMGFPTLFFNASNYLIRDDLAATLNNRYHIPPAIVPDSPSHEFLDMLDYLSRSHGKPLVIIIDAINEHPDYHTMLRSLLALAHHAFGKHIKIIMTCRDIYWDYFESTEWEQLKYSESKNQLFHFSHSEFQEAKSRYFVEYGITGHLSAPASQKYQHPLLLRFFCEAFRNTNIDTINDIRLPELFEEYWNRKVASAAQIPTPRSRYATHSVERYIGAIALHMYRTQQQWIPKESIPCVCGEQDVDAYDSIYSRILGEAIILEERKNPASLAFEVRFVYEEFMEYVIARELEAKFADATEAQIGDEIVQLAQLSTGFVNIYGIMIHLSILLKRNRQVSIWNTLIQLRGIWADIAFEALEKLSADSIDESVVDIIRDILTLENVPEAKDRVISILAQREKFHNNPAVISLLLDRYQRADLLERKRLIRILVISTVESAMQKVTGIMKGRKTQVDLLASICDMLASPDNRVAPSRRIRLLSFVEGHSAKEIRVRTAFAYGSLATEEAQQRLQRLLHDEKAIVRAAVAKACARKNRESAEVLKGRLNVLHSLIDDKSGSVRTAVLKSLSTHIIPATLRTVLRGYSHTDPSLLGQLDRIVREFYDRFAAARMQASEPACLQLREHVPTVFRWLAQRSFDEIQQLFPQLNAVEKGIFTALLCNADSSSAATIVKGLILHRKRPEVSVIAECYLLCDSQLVEYLKDRALDRKAYRTIRAEAVKCLGRMGPECEYALTALLELTSSLPKSDLTLTLSVRQLMNWPAERISGSLVELAQHPDPLIREQIAVLLRELPRPISALPLRCLLSDLNHYVSAAAEASLLSVGIFN